MPLNLNSLTDIDAATQLRRQLLNSQLLSTMGQDAMLGLGIGGAAAGTAGLAGLMLKALRRRRSPKPVQAPVLHIRPKQQQSQAEKTAAVESVLNAAASGRAATQVNSLPYGLPARAIALLLGAGGGAFLTKKLLTGASQHSLDNELENARAEFEAALNGNKAQPTMKLASALDRLEKAASAYSGDKPLDKKALTGMSEGMGELMGLYTLMALLAGGTAGYYGYQGGVKNQKAKKYELAHAARMQRLRKQDPTRPVAVLDQEELTPGF